MRHAGAASLDQLEPVLEELRSCQALVEKSRGVFYRRSRAFLHFHEDPSGLYADVRLNSDFERFRVESAEERVALLNLVSAGLADAANKRDGIATGIRSQDAP